VDLLPMSPLHSKMYARLQPNKY